MGRHVIYLMALARRPPTAAGHGGTHGGGSPSLSITCRYFVHRVHVPPNRSTAQTPTLRIFHRVTRAFPAAYLPLQPTTHPSDGLCDAATSESRRRRRLPDSGSLWRGLRYPLQSYSDWPSSHLPTRRLLRHHQLDHLAAPDPAPPEPLSARPSGRSPIRRSLRHPQLGRQAICRPGTAFAALSITAQPFPDSAQPASPPTLPSGRFLIRRNPQLVHSNHLAIYRPNAPCALLFAHPSLRPPTRRSPHHSDSRRPTQAAQSTPISTVRAAPRPASRQLPYKRSRAAPQASRLTHRPSLSALPHSGRSATYRRVQLRCFQASRPVYRSAQSAQPHSGRPAYFRSAQSALPPDPKPAAQLPTDELSHAAPAQLGSQQNIATRAASDQQPYRPTVVRPSAAHADHSPAACPRLAQLQLGPTSKPDAMCSKATTSSPMLDASRRRQLRPHQTKINSST